MLTIIKYMGTEISILSFYTNITKIAPTITKMKNKNKRKRYTQKNQKFTISLKNPLKTLP